MPVKLTHQNGVLRVCVDRIEEGRASGRVYSQRLAAPLPFSSMGGLLLQLERLLEEQNFPQASQRLRTFGGAVPVRAEAVLPEGAMDAGEVAGARGEIATFALNILSRRNATWQGRLDWLDGGPAQVFSSDLELLDLVEQRLDILSDTITL